MNEQLYEQLLDQSRRLAEKLGHHYITIEHLLCILTESACLLVSEALSHSADCKQNELQQTVKDYLDKQIPPRNQTRGIKETMAFQRVFHTAERLARRRGELTYHEVYLLLAIFYEKESKARFFLKQHQLTEAELQHFIAQCDVSTQTKQARQGNVQVLLREKQEESSDDGDFMQNMNQAYRQGKLAPMIGRKQEMKQLIRILAQSRKSNPLLIGEPGVGKTCLINGLVAMIETGKVPAVLSKAIVYSLDLAGLMAGTQYRGEFESRMKQLVDTLKQDKQAILFVDEIHMMVGAGSTSGNKMDMANILKPALASGEISCIGATTYKEFLIFEKDEALARRFQKVDVPEPSIEESFAIIQGVKGRIEKHHHLKIQDEAIRAAIKLAKQYIPDRRLPDIAMDIIDEACANHSLFESSSGEKSLGVAEVECLVAEKTKIPIEKVGAGEQDQLEHLAKNLKAHIFGQDHAVDAVALAVQMAHAGLRDDTKPIGSFLFSGPTGVGKTELSKQLAEHLGLKLLRFDMSEYMEKHTVSKLIGAPPGYVGHDQPGLLTDAVRKDPHAVLLLDEIEKAHVDIYNILLQVMDYGTLTDSSGKKVNFRHVILIMTTNAGARTSSKKSIGFTEQDHGDESTHDLARVFSPEFRNRLDDIIQFNPLKQDMMQGVIRKHLKELQAMLEQKGVSLCLTDAAYQWFQDKGHEPGMGARPMARWVNQALKKPLAKELLFGRLKNGGSVEVDVENEQLFFRFPS